MFSKENHFTWVFDDVVTYICWQNAIDARRLGVVRRYPVCKSQCTAPCSSPDVVMSHFLRFVETPTPRTILLE